MEYVNNLAFLQAIVEYKAAVIEAENAGDPKPRIPEYVGECILKIATHLSSKPNFINYTYKDDMISDGIENCIMYFDNFDPAKSSNPFAYFTQIIWYAFIRRIQKEKKQMLIKSKIIMEMPFDIYDPEIHGEGTEYVDAYVEFMKNNGIYTDIIDQDDQRKAKKKSKKIPLEEILEEDELELEFECE